MNIIKHILSHSVLIIIGFFAAFIYLNRAEILPEWVPSADGVVASAKQIFKDAKNLDAAIASDVADSTPKSTSASTDSGPTKETESAVAEESEPVVEQKTDNEQLRQAARQAFWNKDLEAAAEHYKALLETEAASDADIHGELGNVYYAAGRWQEAGSAYFEAAIRLLDRGEANRAHYLYKVIQGLDAEHAAELGERLGIPAPQQES